MPARPARPLAARLATWVVLLGALAVPAPAPAATDASDYLLAWLRGGWRSPLLCTFAGETRQGVRRIVITEGPRRLERRVDRITFSALEAQGAERCRNPLGGDAPNLVGSVLVGYTPRRPHSDTPQRDFQRLLKEGPVELEIVAGRLRIGSTQETPDRLPEVDFTGGRAEADEIPDGSDHARVLVDFGPRRRLWLALEAPDGTRVELPLVQFERR